eukprot:133698-Pelagomonas_calceolata.AAC.1
MSVGARFFWESHIRFTFCDIHPSPRTTTPVQTVTFNPKDNNTFASASLDRSIKVWSLGQPMPNFTLEGHDKGVNCLDYFSGG